MSILVLISYYVNTQAQPTNEETKNVQRSQSDKELKELLMVKQRLCCRNPENPPAAPNYWPIYWSTSIPISISILFLVAVHQLSLMKCHQINLTISLPYIYPPNFKTVVSSRLQQQLNCYCFIHRVWRESICEFFNQILLCFNISGRPELCYNLDQLSILMPVLMVFFINCVMLYAYRWIEHKYLWPSNLMICTYLELCSLKKSIRSWVSRPKVKPGDTYGCRTSNEFHVMFPIFLAYMYSNEFPTRAYSNRPNWRNAILIWRPWAHVSLLS
jgi:hypothetical protein